MNSKTLVLRWSGIGLVVMGLGAWQPAYGFTKGACKDDMQKLCAGMKGKEARQCLKQHKDELSDACKQNISEMKQERKEVHEACKADVQKLCADIKPGQGRIRQCLKAHESEISQGCKDKIAEAKDKMKGAAGAPVNPPPPPVH